MKKQNKHKKTDNMIINLIMNLEEISISCYYSINTSSYYLTFERNIDINKGFFILLKGYYKRKEYYSSLFLNYSNIKRNNYTDLY